MFASMRKLIQSLASRPEVIALLDTWPDLHTRLLDDTLAIQAIPAPTFVESARAALIESRFRQLGLADITRDDMDNVYTRTSGTDHNSPALLISAHLDTVFPMETDLTVRYEPAGERIYGPGLGDNSIGLAAMLALVEQLNVHQIIPPADIWWVATVGEEGLGDLRGIRRASEQLRGKIGLAIILEGMGLGRIYHAGLGVRRLRVTVKGPGGHSWLHADRPSAIHHLLRLGEALVDDVQVSDEPRASLNVGLISGGISINTIAPEASLAIDLRSVEAGTLADLEERVTEIVELFSHAPDLKVSTEVIGDRPSATLPVEHPLVQAAQGVLNYLDYDAPSLEIGSTDANVPLANGIPSVCVGITSGGDAHTTGEYIETAPLVLGMRQLSLLALLAVEHVEEWHVWDRVAQEDT